jgi:hypothetical protein
VAIEDGKPAKDEPNGLLLVVVAALCVGICLLMVLLPPGALIVDAVYGGF